MHHTPFVGSGQLFCLLFLSSCFLPMSLSGTDAGVQPLSAVFCLPAAAVFFGLLCAYLRRKQNLLSAAQAAFPPALAFAAALLYALYFMLSAVLSAAQVQTLLRTELMPEYASFWLLLPICAAACYGAWAGLEALARAAAFLFVFVLPVYLLLFILLLRHINFLNYSPAVLLNVRDALSGGTRLAGKLPELAALLLFFPAVRRPGRVFWGWLCAALALLTISALYLTGVLGSLTESLRAPFYGLAELAELGSMQRWDALCLAVWCFSAFCRISLLLLGVGRCFSVFFGEKAAKTAVLAGGCVLLASAEALALFPDFAASGALPALLQLLCGVLCLLLPALILLLLHQRKGAVSA